MFVCRGHERLGKDLEKAERGLLVLTPERGIAALGDGLRGSLRDQGSRAGRLFIPELLLSNS